MSHFAGLRRALALPALALLTCGVLAPHAHAQQTLYATDPGSGNVYAFAPNGTHTTLASGFGGLTSGGLTILSGIAVNRSGTVFFNDRNDGNIYQVAPQGGTPTVFASGFFGAVDDLTFDANGNLFAVNASAGSITKVTLGGVQSTFVSGLGFPTSMVFDRNGNAFVSDSQAGNIYEYTPSGVRLTLASGLIQPFGLAINASGNLFVSEDFNHSVIEVTPSGVQSTFVPQVIQPFGLAINASDSLFVADGGTDSIYAYTPSGQRSTFATGLNNPFSLAFSPAPSAPAVPEPGTMALLMGLGVSGAGVWARRRKSRRP